MRFQFASTLTERVLRERQIARITASVERLDDEIYKAAVNGNAARARYLEWVREQVPRWLAEGEERGRRLRAERDA